MSILDDAIECVVAFLDAMERRDLATAQNLIDETRLELVFPGDRRFRCLDDVVANSAGRYRSVGKIIETRDAWLNANTVRVLITGTLYGKWHDGTPFSGIRFVDWFELTDGRIVRQHVWNDAAERLVMEKEVRK